MITPRRSQFACFCLLVQFRLLNQVIDRPNFIPYDLFAFSAGRFEMNDFSTLEIVGRVTAVLLILAALFGSWLLYKYLSSRCPQGGAHYPEARGAARARTWTNYFYVVHCTKCGKGLHAVGCPWGAEPPTDHNHDY